MQGFGPDTTRVILELWAWLLVTLLSALGMVGNLTLYGIGEEGQEAVASRFRESIRRGGGEQSSSVKTPAAPWSSRPVSGR